MTYTFMLTYFIDWFIMLLIRTIRKWCWCSLWRNTPSSTQFKIFEECNLNTASKIHQSITHTIRKRFLRNGSSANPSWVIFYLNGMTCLCPASHFQPICGMSIFSMKLCRFPAANEPQTTHHTCDVNLCCCRYVCLRCLLFSINSQQKGSCSDQPSSKLLLMHTNTNTSRT